MRNAEVILKSTICGKVRQVARVTGDMPAILAAIRQYAPQVPTQEARLAMLESAWADEARWIGGHTLAVQVMAIAMPGGELVESAKHLEEL